MVRELIEGTDRELIGEPFEEIRGGQAWSPDGERIAFVGRRQDHDELWIISSAGWARDPRCDGAGRRWGPPAGRPMAGAWRSASTTSSTRSMPTTNGRRNRCRDKAEKTRSRLVARRQADRAGQQSDVGLRGAESRGDRSASAGGNPTVYEGNIVYGTAFTPDGRRLVLGGDPVHTGVQVWNLATDKAKRLGGQGISIAMFPDGRRFATSWLSPTIQIIDIDTGEIVRELQHGNTVRSIAVSKDGGALSGGLDRIARVWDPTSGETLCTFDEHQHWITRAVFSPNGREAITVGHDKTLRVGRQYSATPWQSRIPTSSGAWQFRQTARRF